MKKEFNMMLIIVICAILGIVNIAILNILYSQGTLIDSFVIDTITINDLTFLIFLLWIIIGITIGVLKE